MADSRADLPLLHAREQAAAIRELFSADSEVYIGAEATKTRLQQRLEVAREHIDVLHIACHGYFHANQALKSGLMLAPEHDGATGDAAAGALTAEESSWNLTAEEIFGLAMVADLVTLSACESGISDRRPGDELIGLTRALIYAGTPSVVVSLWSVDEVSTSILMQEFYAGLRAGNNKATALQRAQQHVMRINARDAIAYCERAKVRLTAMHELPVQRTLDRDIATIEYRAGDFEAARGRYEILRSVLDPQSPGYQELKQRIDQCEGASRSRSRRSPDYSIPVYQHPYHWAPFVLVGDWQ